MKQIISAAKTIRREALPLGYLRAGGVIYNQNNDIELSPRLESASLNTFGNTEMNQINEINENVMRAKKMHRKSIKKINPL